MLDFRNSRLKFIFTSWFFIVAIVPSLFVAFASYTLQRDQLVSAVYHELETATRLKSETVRSFLSDQQLMLRDIASDYSIAQDLEAAGVTNLGADALYVVTTAGTRIDEAGEIDQVAIWTPSDDMLVKPSSTHLYIAEPLVFPSGWLVAVFPHSLYAPVLHEDINDSQFFTPNRARSEHAGIGSSGDFFLMDSEGNLLTSSVYDSRVPTMNVSSELSQLVISGTRVSSGQASIFNENSFYFMQPFDLNGEPVVAVTSISSREVVGRLYDNQRNLLAIYLFSLVGVFVIMYLFVNNIGSIVISPIFRAIQSLINSSAKLRASIEKSHDSVQQQTDVAGKLSDAYREQVNDIKKVDAAITSIVESLSSISKQTKITTKSAELIDDLAADGKKEAVAASDSIKTIEQIAIAHDTLVESLQTYSFEVDRVAKDVQKISKAITYLSLNAGIEAEKPEMKLESLSSIASEVGKLSHMSDQASIRINELVSTIQHQLSQTRKTVIDERSQAEQSIITVNRALSVLQKMSSDALKISTSVKQINTDIQRQSESAYEIVVQSHQLMKESKEGSREVSKLRSLIKSERDVVRSNVSVVRKLVANIKGLRSLIGSRDTEDNGKA